MRNQALPNYPEQALRTATAEEQQAKLQRLIDSSKAASQRPRQSLAVSKLHNVVLDKPAKSTKVSTIPKRPVFQGVGGENRSTYASAEERPFEHTADDMDILLFTQEVDFSQSRIVADMLGRSQEGVRKRMNRLVAGGFLEQVKGPYMLPNYRITAKGVQCLNFDTQMPIRHFDMFDSQYTRRCHIVGVVSDIYGRGGNVSMFGPNMPDGRIAVLSGTRITNGALQLAKAKQLTVQRLHEDQRSIELDLAMPQASGPVATADDWLGKANDLLRFWHGPVSVGMKRGIWNRAYVFTTIDKDGIWSPDYVAPGPMTIDGKFVSVAGIVCTDFESREVMVRNILNLYLTYSVVRCEIRFLSSAIAEEYRRVLFEMEADGTLPAGASNLFHLLRLNHRNYTGNGSDRLTATGLERAITGFHG